MAAHRRAAHRARTAAWRTGSGCGHEERWQGRFPGNRRDVLFAPTTLMLTALGAGATQFITYGLGNFTTLFLMREKGMSLQRGRPLLRARRRHRDELRHLCLRTGDRSLYAPLQAAYGLVTCPLADTGDSALHWLRLGAELAGSLLFLIGPTFLNYFYLSSSVALVQEQVRPQQRVMSGALLLLVMNFIGLGLGPTYVGWASDFFRATHPGHSLQIALYTLLPFYGVAIILFLSLARVLRREQTAVQGVS